MTINFENSLVDKVSTFLQDYLRTNSLNFLTADESAELLAKHNILSNKVGPKPGFNFRQMLRDGRDKKINLVTGACQQRARTKWFIYKTELLNK
jgi:hypothetical protein